MYSNDIMFLEDHLETSWFILLNECWLTTSDVEESEEDLFI
ncbi:unnamed protein product [Meloidogyne enterolobii]|uniref:Uncharacterized protein n=1 Tax=Meloidogyne enterolobii TaxID=390850 RepID=A0ACB0Y5L0_MELEN